MASGNCGIRVWGRHCGSGVRDCGDLEKGN